VQVNAQPRTIFFAARTRGDYPITMAGWGTLTGEAGYALSSFVHTNQGQGGRYGAFNVSHFSDPAIDAVIAEGMRTMDDTARRALFQRAQDMAVAAHGQIPIVTLPTAWAGRASLAFTPRADEETLAHAIRPR
jgi:peptide/nickel transport system substrate-binding protein